MKKIIGIILSLIVALTIVSCDDSTFDLDYKAPLAIGFTDVDNSNIVTVDKGVLNYTVNIEVNSPTVGIKYFEIYNADPKTGNIGTLIGNTSKALVDEQGNGVKTYSVAYTITNLIENKCIKVIATDGEGNPFERNLLVNITPTVLFSGSLKIETTEDYYGPYYATWLDGRVYMRRNGEAFKNEIDFSLGDVVIASEGTSAVPALVNPAQRTTFSLLTIAGLQETKYELTSLTKAQYDAITQVDASPIAALAVPTQDAVKLVNGKVYLFKTANNKKGLIYISALAAKTGTLENLAGEWKVTPYSQAIISTKVVVP